MTCRICLEDGELIQPCDCRGSSAYVHEKCLIKWLQVSKRTDCEICHFQYDITEVEETRHVACPGCSFGDSNSANTVVFLVGILGHFVMMFFMSAQMFVSTTEDFFVYANLLQGFMLLFLHAKVWGDGDLLLVLEGHEGRVRSVSWNPKGDTIVSGSDDKTVRVWDATYGYCLHILTGHESRVASVSWSPEGNQIVSGSLDKTARVWDVPIARKKRKYAKNTDTLQVPFVEPPSDEICIICMDAFDIKSIATHGYAVRLECGHFFHRSCIKQWQKPGETEVDPLEYEEGVTYSQSGYQMPGTKCPVCRKIAKKMFPDGILRLRF